MDHRYTSTTGQSNGAHQCQYSRIWKSNIAGLLIGAPISKSNSYQKHLAFNDMMPKISSNLSTMNLGRHLMELPCKCYYADKCSVWRKRWKKIPHKSSAEMPSLEVWWEYSSQGACGMISLHLKRGIAREAECYRATILLEISEKEEASKHP